MISTLPEPTLYQIPSWEPKPQTKKCFSSYQEVTQETSLSAAHTTPTATPSITLEETCDKQQLCNEL